jgi:hypothetical protein
MSPNPVRVPVTLAHVPTFNLSTVFSSFTWRKLVGVVLVRSAKRLILGSARPARFAKSARLARSWPIAGTPIPCRAASFCLGILLMSAPAHAASFSIPQAADWTSRIAFVALFAILFYALRKGLPRHAGPPNRRSRPGLLEMLGFSRGE